MLDHRCDAAALSAQTDTEARSTLSVDLNAETDSKRLLNAASPLESMSSEACVVWYAVQQLASEVIVPHPVSKRTRPGHRPLRERGLGPRRSQESH